MKIRVVDLKTKPYKVELVDNNKITKLSASTEYRVNGSVMVLTNSNTKVVLGSFALAKIFQISKKDYDEYLKDLSQKKVIPTILLDLNLIIPNNNNPRVPQPSAYFRNLQLNLTPNCNLRCRYCYAMSGRRDCRKAMPYAVAKAAIDYVALYCQGELNLNFIGEGEATTEFKLLKQVFSYAQRKIAKVAIHPISTNGVISKEIADWLIKNAQSLQVSCDGPAFIQNKYRPLANGGKSSLFVERTIHYLVKKKKNFDVRITMSQDFFGNELKIINYFLNLGVQKMAFGPLENLGAATTMVKASRFKLTEKLNQLPNVIEEYKKLLEIQDELKLPINLLHFNHLGTTMTCSIYTKTTLVIDPQGIVSTCEKHNDSGDFVKYPFMRNFVVGQYDKNTHQLEVDLDKVESLKKLVGKQWEINGCETCNFLSACPAICLHNVGEKSGILNPSYSTCTSLEKKAATLTFNYFAERYLGNKKPCLEFKNGELFYSLLYTDFQLHLSKNSQSLRENPYIVIDDPKALKVLIKKILAYRKSRQDLTVFLITFHLEQKNLNYLIGKQVLHFIEKLQSSGIYYKITEPLSEQLFKEDYKDICRKFEIPFHYNDCLELFRVKDDKVFLSQHTIGSKKFSDYEDREEICKDFSRLQELTRRN